MVSLSLDIISATNKPEKYITQGKYDRLIKKFLKERNIFEPDVRIILK
jgi:hypothetical protein